MTVASSVVRPPVPMHGVGSPPPNALLPLDEVCNRQITLSLPLEKLTGPWQNVTVYLLTRAAMEIREQDAAGTGASAASRWQASLAQAWTYLPQSLSGLMALPDACSRYGLHDRLPVTLRVAVFRAVRDALYALGREGVLSPDQAEQQLLLMNDCLLLPMKACLQHCAFSALFDALYLAARASPPRLLRMLNPIPH